LSNWLLGVLLGVVQGISEWLPISSKTQIIFVSTYLYGFTLAQAYAFGLFMEVGTFFAALFYFRSEVIKVLKALVGRGDEEGKFLLKYLVIVTAITAVIGAPIYLFVSEMIAGLAIGIPMILLGIILILDGTLIRLARGRYTPRKAMGDLSILDEILIGIAQAISAFPGVSRSGTTVSAMLLLGVKPNDSFRMSFLALIPASIGASALTLIFSGTQISYVLSSITLPVLILAIVVAVVVSLLFIDALLRFAASSRITILVFTLGVIAVLSGVASIIIGFG
jgi:undecaprenyl-diphosphatase